MTLWISKKRLISTLSNVYCQSQIGVKLHSLILFESMYICFNKIKLEVLIKFGSNVTKPVPRLGYTVNGEHKGGGGG